MNSNIMLSNNMILVFQRLCNKPSISTKFLWTKGSLCSEGFVQGDLVLVMDILDEEEEAIVERVATLGVDVVGVLSD